MAYHHRWIIFFLVATSACLKPKSTLKVNLSSQHITAAEATAVEQKIGPLITKFTNDSMNEPPTFDCTDQEKLISYVFIVNGRDEGQSCVNVVDQCRASNPDAIAKMPEVVALAGLCASYDAETYERSKQLIDQAIQGSSDRDPGRKFILFSRLETNRNEALKLMAASSLWDDTQKAALTAFLTYGPGSDFTFDQDGSVRKFVDQELASEANSSRYKGILAAFYVRGLQDKSRYEDAIAFLGEHIDALEAAFFMMETSYLYDTFYALPDVGLQLARDIYDRYEPLTSKNWKLPIENNSYTYTELYSKVCTDHLLPADPLKQLKTLDAQWLNAKVTTADAMAQALELAKTYPGRADLLTFVGTMQMAQGAYDDSVSTFWQAHVACKYYDRAHDGIRNALGLRDTKADATGYAAILALQAKGLSGVTVPASLPNFVVGYQVLNGDYQATVNYALKFWFPYIADMAQRGGHISLIWPATLTSDLPNQEHIRDERGPAYDVRLLDDVGGIDSTTGNSMSRLSRLIEKFNNPDTTANTFAHEVTHQFHKTYYAKVGPCLKKLYTDAKARNGFLNGYSSTNVYEYFATAVGSYTGDPTAIQKVDPNLYAYIQAIGAGNLDAVQCPI